MKYLLLIVKGFLIGIGKIIPGVSGAVLAISLGVYEQLLNIIAHPLKINFKDIKFLFFLLIGAGTGILLFCNIIKMCLHNYYLPTIFAFTGLIFGGLPEIFLHINNKSHKISNYFIFLFSLLFIQVISNISGSYDESSNHYFIMGVIESLTTIIPGISGTAIFMALGWYDSLLKTINDILTFSAGINVYLLFLAGFIISTILISKIISYLFKMHKEKTYYCILGFMSGSIFSMIKNVFNYSFNFGTLVFCIILFFIGYFFTLKINDFFSKF